MGIEMSDRGILQHIWELEGMERAVEASRNCTQEPSKDTPTPSVGAAIIHNGKVLKVAYRGEQAPGDHAEFTLLEKRGCQIFCVIEFSLSPGISILPSKSIAI